MLEFFFVLVLACGKLVNTQSTCNPLQNICSPVVGLNSTSYAIDFTNLATLPPEWVLADGSIVSYGSNGAEFSIKKRYDAPYIWSSFQILFGRVEVVVQAASGTGIITGVVLMSDDQDEIDWEWSGNNFGSNTGRIQTNYFGKGITGTYDRGTQPEVDSPTTKFHTYTLDWTPSSLSWMIDGVKIRTLENNNQQSGQHQYPQTPSRLHLGVWNGGDPDGNPGVIQWAGGVTDYSKVPFTAFIKSVEITTPNPCSSWQYPPNFSGKWQDVQCTNQSLSTLPQPTNLPCNYTVLAGDYGIAIASKLGISFETLKNAQNPAVNWDALSIGQVLTVPGTNCVASKSAVSTLTTSSTTAMSKIISTSMIPMIQYTIVAGDYGYRIADKNGISFEQLQAGNPDVDWDALQIGQVLNLPARNPSPTRSSKMVSSLFSNPTSTSQYSLIPKPTTSKSGTLASSSTTKLTCNQDLCLRNMLNPEHITSMRSLCPSILSPSKHNLPSNTSTNTNPSTHNTTISTTVSPFLSIPTFLNGCSNNPTRISSACRCVLTNYPTATTFNTPSPTNNARTIVSSMIQGSGSQGGKLRIFRKLL